MDVKLELVSEKKEESAVIRTTKVTETIAQAMALLTDTALTISGTKDAVSYVLDVSKIYYIEAVDNKTFISMKNDVYESKLKLYELEEILDHRRFLRCSKSMICNASKIKHVKASLNGRFEATLLNLEHIVISRSYVKDLKKILGIGGK